MPSFQKELRLIFFILLAVPARTGRLSIPLGVAHLGVFRPSRCVTKSSKTPGFTRRGAL
jgi:hypothetical protein